MVIDDEAICHHQRQRTTPQCPVNFFIIKKIIFTHRPDTLVEPARGDHVRPGDEVKFLCPWQGRSSLIAAYVAIAGHTRPEIHQPPVDLNALRCRPGITDPPAHQPIARLLLCCGQNRQPSARICKSIRVQYPEMRDLGFLCQPRQPQIDPACKAPIDPECSNTT